MPERRAGIVVLTNGGEASSSLVGMLANYAYDRLAGRPNLEEKLATQLTTYGRQLEKRQAAAQEDRARRQSRLQTAALPFSAYVGVFENPKFGRLVISLKESRLSAQMGVARSAVEVYDGAKHQFRIDIGTGEQVIVFNIVDGRPVAVRFAGEVFTALE